MPCPVKIVVQVGLAIFIAKSLYDAIIIYRKNNDDAKKDEKKVKK